VPALDDFWAYRFETRRWEQLAMTNSNSARVPGPRFLTTLMSHRGNEIVMFGGENMDVVAGHEMNPKFNDLWTYSPVSNSWRETSTGGCQAGDQGTVFRAILDPQTFVTAGIVCLATASAMILIKMGRGVWKRRIGNSYASVND
jgi:hypothetical protein